MLPIEPTSRPTFGFDSALVTEAEDGAKAGTFRSAVGSKAYNVAFRIARDATDWVYDEKVRAQGGRSCQDAFEVRKRFDRKPKGVCIDMALEAAQRFHAQGIKSRVRIATIHWKSKPAGTTSNHAWVEYLDGAAWKRFDPTVAASSDRPEVAFMNLFTVKRYWAKEACSVQDGPRYYKSLNEFIWDGPPDTRR